MEVPQQGQALEGQCSSVIWGQSSAPPPEGIM